MIELFAQLKIHERTGKEDGAERNGICPRWIVDNFDRYTHPFLQQLVLVLLSVAMGFAIAFGLSTDYQVFLLSRVREEIDAGASPRRAVVAGLGGPRQGVAAGGAVIGAPLAPLLL